MNVLFFDDEPFTSMALADILKLYGWNIVLVSKIDKLFMLLANHQYDILILDIMAPVPKMNNCYINFKTEDIEAMEGGYNTGIVLAEKIWEDAKNIDIPILFLSARGGAAIIDSIAQFRKKGKNCRYLRKPELAETIHETLQGLLTK